MLMDRDSRGILVSFDRLVSEVGLFRRPKGVGNLEVVPHSHVKEGPLTFPPEAGD